MDNGEPNTMIFIRAAVFFTVTLVLAYLSRGALLNPRSHGFFRFFAWESILGLILLNLPVWTVDRFAPHQLVSWVFLIISIVLAIEGFRLLRLIGKPTTARTDSELFGFEKTSALVTVGIYAYIRHPLYAALLFLAWGAFLKSFTPVGVLLISVASVCLFLTAKFDESECLKYFGPTYKDYMRKTKNFVPFVF